MRTPPLATPTKRSCTSDSVPPIRKNKTLRDALNASEIRRAARETSTTTVNCTLRPPRHESQACRAWMLSRLASVLRESRGLRVATPGGCRRAPDTLQDAASAQLSRQCSPLLSHLHARLAPRDRWLA